MKVTSTQLAITGVAVYWAVAVWYFFIRDEDVEDSLTFRFPTPSGVRARRATGSAAVTKSARYDPDLERGRVQAGEHAERSGRLRDATGMGGATAKETWFARACVEGGKDRPSPAGTGGLDHGVERPTREGRARGAALGLRQQRGPDVADDE